jgi:hypothetical protein
LFNFALANLNTIQPNAILEYCCIKEFTNIKSELPMNEPTKGIIDINGNIIADLSKYDWVSDFDEFGYAYVESKGLIGLVNIDGKEILPPKYENVWVLDSEHFLVRFDKTSYNIINNEGEKLLNDDFEKCDWNAKEGHLIIYKNGKYGLCSYQGDMLIEYKYQEIDWIDCIYKFYILYSDDVHIGIADSNGREIIPAIFVELYQPDGNYDIVNDYLRVLQFPIVRASKSVFCLDKYNCAVKKEDKWRFIDENGNLLDYDIPSLDDWNIDLDSETEFSFIIVKDGLKGVFYRGEIIIPAEFDEIDLDSKICCKKGDKVLYYNYDGKQTDNLFKRYLCSGYEKFFVDGKVGVVDDMRGKEIIPPVYDDIINTYRPSVPIFELVQDGKYGWYLLKSKTIISPRFDDVDFEADCVFVKLGDKTSIADFHGNIKNVPQYIAKDRLNNGNYLYGTENWHLQGMFDKDGKIIVEPIYDDLKLVYHSSYIRVNKGQLYGLMNLDGEITIEPKYDSLDAYAEGTVFCGKLGDVWQVMDANGHNLFNQEFENVESIQGMFAVKANDKWGLMSYTGEVLLPIENNLEYYNTYGKVFVTPKGNIVFYDHNSNQLVERNLCDVKTLDNGYFITINLDKTKDLRAKDSSIVESNIESIDEMRESYKVRKDNRYGLLNTSNGLSIVR